MSSFFYSGPADVELSDINSAKLTVTGLHIDESIGSPTVYEFMLTVVDYRNLTDNDTVFVIYRKGIPPSLPLPSPSLSPHSLSPPSLFLLLSMHFSPYPHISDPQTPPKASAGPSVTIALPQDTVSLDGSRSADDFGIVSYQWERSSNSPAAGVSNTSIRVTIFMAKLHIIIMNLHTCSYRKVAISAGE